jgi:CBS domain-containing protein
MTETTPSLPTTVYTVTPETPVNEVARLLVARHIGDVIVVQGNKPVGILTDRDLVARVMAAGLDPRGVKVGQVMSGPLVTIDRQEELGAALTLMTRHGIRRLPIVDEAGRLVSILTMDEMLQLGLANSPELAAILRQQFHPDKPVDAPRPLADRPSRQAEPSRLDFRQPIVAVHRQTVLKPLHRHQPTRLDYARAWIFWNRDWLQFTALLASLTTIAVLLAYYLGTHGVTMDQLKPKEFYEPKDEERQLYLEHQRAFDKSREDKRRERQQEEERRSRGRP